MCRAMAMTVRRAAPDEEGGFKRVQLTDQIGARAAFRTIDGGGQNFRLGRGQTHRHEGCRLNKAFRGTEFDELAHTVVLSDQCEPVSVCPIPSDVRQRRADATR